MKLFLQWTQGRAADWRPVESGDWDLLPWRPAPAGGEALDDRPGWIHGLSIMGTGFFGYDHIAVADEPDGSCTVTAWKDDPDDYPPEEFLARVLRVWPPAPDPALGGAINTRGDSTLYCGAAVMARFRALGPIENTILRPWQAFRAPQNARHGIWTPDALHGMHEGARTRHGWREWSAGIDPALLDAAGNIAPQRPLGLYNKPDGTKTYYQRDTALATGIHATQQGANEAALEATAGTGQTLTDSQIGGGQSVFAFIWTTQSGEPDSAAWPTGTYRCQLDVATVDADITFGLRTAGAVSGHFARVNNLLSSDLETKQQTQGLFAPPAGLKLATTGSVSWAAGAASDRFECAVAATRAANHGNQTLSVTLDADAFADGPWTAAVAADQLMSARQRGQVDPVRRRNSVIGY